LCDVLDEAALGSEHRLRSVVQFETYQAPRFSNLSFNEIDFATVTPSANEC
jgi:hypothetical protein